MGTLGLGICVAIGLDAFLIRPLVVPATMRLLGNWNWWLPGQRRGKPSPAAAGESGLRSQLLPLSEQQAQRAWEALLIRLVAQTLQQPVTRQSHFFTSGGDSHSLEQLLLRIKQHLGVTLTVEEVLTHPVLAALAVLVQQRLLQQEEQGASDPSCWTSSMASTAISPR
ncbi:MAG: hypothetical protein IRZ31_18135 [Thermogemmatispora sp.]|uniref:acyl carrier protein n=1 Tax=Thermogemmatispora sp. TaxID=1968838 RepID=UPI00263627AF|nr:phosphopantetheine-binding protein [Thermogemmatispora sp.]MBX5458816.1 hypothetical protein [Thermogemmatispora sp.]